MSQKLRIGVVVGTRDVPAWIRQVVDFLAGVPRLIVFLHLADVPECSTAQPAPWSARKLYERSRRHFDPFAPVPGEAIASSHDEDFDLLLLTPGLTSSLTARYGTISFQFGERDLDPPYWGEVMARDPVSRVTLCWRENASTPMRAVRTAEVPTRRGLGFTWNADKCLLAATQMVAEVALDIFSERCEWVGSARSLPLAAEMPERRHPTNLGCAAFAIREAARSLTRRKGGARKTGWFCALRRDPKRFYNRSGAFEESGFEEISMEPGAQMADPFLVRDQGRDWLFVEEVPPGKQKGRLSCMEVPEPGQPLPKAQVVLECDTHLSYPCVFRHRSEYFMIPESCASQDLRLYRATRFPHEWQLESVLLENLPVTDTTPIFHDGHWYFFTTTMPPVRQTILLTSATLGGPLRLHRASPVSSSVRNTRAAGHFFRCGGRLLRPTQDCLTRYGYGIQINEVTRLTQSEYMEQAADYIGPSWRRGLLGTHTLNASENLEVIDGCRYFG